LLDVENFSIVRPVGKARDADVVAAMNEELNDLAGRIASTLQHQQRG